MQAASDPAMDSFHRVKRDSRVLGVLGLVILFPLALFLTLVGTVAIGRTQDFLFGGILTLFGLALFVLFFRAVWMMTGGGLVHVLSIDRETFEWGYRGKEQSLPMAEVRSIHWDDTDGFTFVVDLKDGKRIRMLFMESVVPAACRGRFLRFLRTNFPAIEIRGVVSPATERAAAGA